MDTQARHLIDQLEGTQHLEVGEYQLLLEALDPQLADYAAQRARAVRQPIYGTRVYVRGLIEISSYCRNNCHYCGLRRDNRGCQRYRLTPDEILACADAGYDLGFRTFVLQGGEDPHLGDEVMVPLVARLRANHPDCAITLSLGERSRESYAALREAGADRYLLRHEAADPGLYSQLHPREMSLENRLRCLDDLRELGYAVGCGFMVGAPHQGPAHLAADLAFVERFRPAMCGIGPFVPHHATPYAAEPHGTVELTCFCLSLLRLMQPSLLLPATTSLGTIDPQGREKGMLAGANVVMPNLSPAAVRQKYELYDNKICTGEEAAEGRESLQRRMAAIGYEVVVDRGDPKACSA